MKKYLVVIEEEESNLSAYSPDVLGVGITGNTIDEILVTMREALEWSLESRAEQGLPIPEHRGAQSYRDVGR